MSETPGSPEYYTPSPDSAPPPVPQPQSISDAAAQWNAGDGNSPVPDYAQQYAPPVPPTPYGYAPPPPPAYMPGGPRPTAGLSIASLVVGLIAFITFWIPGAGGPPPVIIATIPHPLPRRRRSSAANAISGIVTGALGAILSAGIPPLIIYGTDTSSHDDFDEAFTAAPRDDVTTLGPTPVEGSSSVAEQAFGPTTYDDTVTWFVVILDNPGPGSYSNAEVTINALDASGAVIDTSWSYGTIAPGRSAVGSAFYDLGGAEVASLQVVAPSVDAMSSDSSNGALVVSGLTAVSDSSFTTVTGTATSNSTEPTYGAAITIVARDASGGIIASAFASVDAMEPGDAAPFEALFYEVMPAGTTYEGYAITY